MRIVFMGTPQFAVCSLERLIESQHQVVAAVTRPDRGAGRGRVSQAPPVKDLAVRHNIEVLQPERIRDEAFIEYLRNLKPDLIVVVAYGKILPEAILEIPRLGCLNLHASLLPQLRGAAPINWAIALGMRETGVTIIKMDAGMDTGDILYQESVEILDDDDAESLSNMLSVLGAQRVLEVLSEVGGKDAIVGSPQDHSKATYAPMLTKENGRIEWSRPTENIVCLVRGMKPWPCAFTSTRKGVLKVLRAEPLWPAVEERIPKPHTIPPGTVALTLRSDGFAVRTGDGFVLVTEAQPEGKRAMLGVDLVNGQYVKKGDQLGAEEEDSAGKP